MLEAMWTLRFRRPGIDFGAGVMVLESGRAFGGDSSFSYIGSYNAAPDGKSLIVKLHVSRHAPGLENVFRIDEFDLTLTGNLTPERLQLSGSVDQISGFQLDVIAKRKAELP